MKIDFAKLTFFFIWIIVALTTLFFIFYRDLFLSVGQLILTLTPSIIFFVGMILFYSRDHKRVVRSKEKEEFHFSRDFNWQMATIHDFLTYLIPLVILILPYFFGAQTTLKEITAAIITYLTLIYLKFLYWREL